MKEIKKHQVYKKVQLNECMRVTGKQPTKVKWVEVKKGDQENPDYLARLVAIEIGYGKRDDLFAATIGGQ